MKGELMRFKNIRLRPRDFSLLKDIHDNVFLAFYQIKQRHFQGLNDATVYNRLSKLLQAKCIKRKKVSLLCYHKDNKVIGNVYQLDRRGFEALRQNHLEKELRFPVKLNYYSLYHDLLLTDVLGILKKKYPKTKIQNTKVLEGYTKPNEQVPDAILTLPSEERQVAIELELTGKSKPRYEEIVTSYRLSEHFSSVIYIVLNEQIQKRISSIITGSHSNFDANTSTGSFYFCQLKELLGPNKDTKITNGESHFDFPRKEQELCA